MSWIEIDGQPVKVWQASVINVATTAEPGTILEATKREFRSRPGTGPEFTVATAGREKSHECSGSIKLAPGMVCTWQPSGLTLLLNTPGVTGHFYFVLMKKQLNLRSLAAQAVEQVLERGQSLSNVLPRCNKSLG